MSLDILTRQLEVTLQRIINKSSKVTMQVTKRETQTALFTDKVNVAPNVSQRLRVIASLTLLIDSDSKLKVLSCLTDPCNH